MHLFISANLNVHVKLNHSEVKAIPCSSCDHISNSKRAAKEHEKIHAGQHILPFLALIQTPVE